MDICADFTENIIHNIDDKTVSMLRFVTTVPVLNNKVTEILILLDAISKKAEDATSVVTTMEYKPDTDQIIVFVLKPKNETGLQKKTIFSLHLIL